MWCWEENDSVFQNCANFSIVKSWVFSLSLTYNVWEGHETNYINNVWTQSNYFVFSSHILYTLRIQHAVTELIWSPRMNCEQNDRRELPPVRKCLESPWTRSIRTTPDPPLIYLSCTKHCSQDIIHITSFTPQNNYWGRF